MLPMLIAPRAERSIGWFALASVFTVDYRGPLFAFWFIETVFHALLITAALFLIPAVRQWSATHLFALSLGFVAFAIALKLVVPPFWTDGKPNALTVDSWLYAYMIGWAAFAARDAWQKWLVVALALGLAIGDFGLGSPRPWWFALAWGAILFLPPLRMPRVAATLVMQIASTSYFVYLVHVVGAHFLTARRPVTHYWAANSAILLLASLILGIAYARAWTWGTGQVARQMHLRLPRGGGRAADPGM